MSIVGAGYIDGKIQPLNQTSVTDKDGNAIVGSTNESVISDSRGTNRLLSESLDLTFRLPDKETVTLATGLSNIHSLLRLPNGWVVGITNVTATTSKFIRWKNPYTALSTYDYITFADDGFHYEAFKIVYIPSKDKVYAIFNHANRVTVSEINYLTDPMTVTSPDVISDTTQGTSGWGSMCVTDTHLFVFTNASPTIAVKFLISDWSRVTSATLTGLNMGHAADFDGTSIFVTGSSNPGWIADVNPTDLTFTSQAFASGYNAATDDFALLPDRIIVGIETNLGVYLDIAKSNLAITIKRLNLTTTICYGMFTFGKFVICLLNTSPGTIVFIDVMTDEVYYCVLASGENSVNEFATDGQIMFVTCYLNPAKIIRLTLPNLLLAASQHNKKRLPVSNYDWSQCEYEQVTIDTGNSAAFTPVSLASDGNYDNADASGVATMRRVGISLEASTGSKYVAFSGKIYNSTWNWTVGGLIYVSETAGTLTQTLGAPPAVDSVITPIGIALSADVMELIPNLLLATHLGT